MQIVIANVVPCVFGVITGIMLGVHEVAYLALAGPIGILGGFFAGREHRGAPEGAARGALGGVQFGTFILLAHEVSGLDAKADLPHPAIILVVLTTFFGIILGFFGGLVRERRMKREIPPPAPAA
jgi:hypothetical protein